MKPALSKKLLRSLPTLTEVVDTSPPALRALSMAGAGVDEEALVARVLQRLEATLDTHVQKAVALALAEQMKDLTPRIRRRVDDAVRKAVTQAVVAEIKAPETPAA